ncbi:MAG: hypothetical protein MSJ26_10575 [Oscillospiraceae bacterium]|nr:hypothetical protein [Oscillospiraceae bacterium]
MEKIVKSGLRDCTVILDGTECAVKFDTCFRAFAVRNDGAADVYISKSSGIVPDADGVMCVKAGGSATFAHNDLDKNTVYLLGNGKVQVHAQNDSANPFNFAPAISDGGVTAEGNPVQLDGLQEGIPFSEMIVSGKNLILYPYAETTKTVGGLNITIDNGIIILNGSNAEEVWLILNSKNSGNHIPLIKDKTYKLSGVPKNTDVFMQLSVMKSDDTRKTILYNGTYDSPAYTVQEDGMYGTIAICCSANVAFDNFVIKPQLELGDTATAYEPPITGRELTVGVSGKNLLMINKSTLTANGITATANDDGSITLIGTATAITYIGMWNNLYARNMGVGKIAVNAIDGQSISTYYMGIDRREGGSYIDRIAESITNNGIGEITQEDVENDRYLFVWVRIAAGYTCDNLIIYPQLEIGSTATPYEPYHGAEYTINPDSNPYVIPNGIRQQDGLNVVSVSAGELSVSGVRKNAAVKKIWDKIDELTTAIIVSNGETIE